MQDNFMKQGIFSWNELMTSDVDSARDFYTDLLGWKYDAVAMDDGNTYYVAKVDDVQTAGLFRKPDDLPDMIPPHWRCFITVDNVDRSAELAEELGGRVLLPPTDIPQVGRFCVLQDPQGAVINIITYPKK